MGRRPSTFILSKAAVVSSPLSPKTHLFGPSTEIEDCTTKIEKCITNDFIAFSTTSKSADLLKSKCQSCSVGQDKSAYWTPAVYFMADDGTVEVVPEKPPHKT